MPIRKKKISDLTLADSLKGLFTIGYKIVNGVKISVRIGLEYIQVAYEDVVKATQDAIAAAKTALSAASAADTSRKAIEANEAEREGNEDARKTSEQERAAAEVQRATSETGRVNAEKARVTEFGRLKTDSEKATGDAIAATGKANEAIHNAEVATGEAQVATASANQATINANRAADNADAKAELANNAAANAEDTANHSTYIGTDHYVYKWNKTTKAYDKTDIYCKGDAFSVKKVYASVAALNADVNNSDVKVGDFVLVNTNDVENPDNAKLYVKVKNGSTYAYDFLVDMSGAIGFTGKTPQFSMGTITTLEAGSTATATVSENGVDGNGNPRYKINFAIPRGNPGAPFRVAGQYATLAALQAAVPNGASIDGFMAVGAKVPYNYYAWVSGTWKDQGQIAGGGGNIVNLPASLLNITYQSTSAEILNVFGGADKFRELLKKLSETNCVIQIGTPGTSKHRVYTNVEYYIYYTETGQSDLNINIYTEGPEIKRFHLHLKADNTATCTEASTYQLIDNSKVVNNLTTNDSSKVLAAAQGKALQDSKVNKTDIVNSLTDNSAGKPLSAAAGKTLNDTKQNELIILDVPSMFPSGSGTLSDTDFAKFNQWVSQPAHIATTKIVSNDEIVSCSAFLGFRNNTITANFFSFEGEAYPYNMWINFTGNVTIDTATKKYKYESTYWDLKLTTDGYGEKVLTDDGKYQYYVKGDGKVAGIQKLTQSEYDALPSKDSSTLYIIID